MSDPNKVLMSDLYLGRHSMVNDCGHTCGK